MITIIRAKTKLIVLKFEAFQGLEKKNYQMWGKITFYGLHLLMNSDGTQENYRYLF